MTSHACLAAYKFYKIDRQDITMATHAMVVRVSDLTGKDVKKPRLRIDHIIPCPIAQLPERTRAGVLANKEKRPLRPGHVVLETVIAYEKVAVPLAETFGVDPFVEAAKLDRKSHQLVMISWIQAINDTAKGERPDLYKIVTGK